MGSAMSLAALAFATTLMSCIPTRDASYEPPPNYPPSVHSTGQPPMDRVYVIGSGDGDAGVGGNVDFTATVRDPNVDQSLQGLVFINYNPDEQNTPQLEPFSIPPTLSGEPLDRRASFTLSATQLNRPCQTVHLHVSERFTGILDPRPAVPTDLGVGTWFVVNPGGGDVGAAIAQCPTFSP